MLTESHAIIKQAEGEDADTVSTETIVDLLFQGAFKVAKNIVNRHYQESASQLSSL